MFEAWRKLEQAQHDIKQLKKKQLSRGHGEREPREREETQSKAEKPDRKQPNQELSEKDGKLTQEGGPFLYRQKFYSYPGYPGFPNFGQSRIFGPLKMKLLYLNYFERLSGLHQYHMLIRFLIYVGKQKSCSCCALNNVSL